ncbi:MAG: hypothetical protein CVU14_10505, partial [Bacteroidetes bacterium HGW-Bacteroidetes-9]
MENQELNLSEPILTREPIRLNETAIKSLTETRKWTAFFAILGIIFIVLMIIVAVVFIIVLPMMNEQNNMPFPPALFGFIYLIFSAIYILPVIFLMRFTSILRKAITSTDESLMGLAMKNLALHFRTVGIITIAVISLYVMLIIGMLVLGMGMYAGNLIG